MNSNAFVKLVLCMALIACWRTASADGYYTSQSPYPPGCITLPANQLDLYGDNAALFWSGTLQLEVVHKVESPDPAANLAPVDVAMYRVGCAEPGRSVILVEFRLPAEQVDSWDWQLVLPTFTGSTAMHPLLFELKPEANGWGEDIRQNSLTKRSLGDYSGGWFDAHWLVWTYVLDIGSEGMYWPSPFLVDYYNDRFALELFINGKWMDFYIDVPSTTSVLHPNTSLPLNGRQSGTWIEPGASDQGFLLSFGNPVPPAGDTEVSREQSDLVVFLTWYTFDAQGSQLWLAGNARFPQGASEAIVPLIRVTDGQFLGSEPEPGPGVSTREVVGELRLKSIACNALLVDYELQAIGLGSGRMDLQRLEALETAGYPCRDYESRLASRATGSTR